ncbi:MBOAT (Membrane bound O-acyl transferase) family protein [Citrus sinensis]|nr:MBOAT (Membrane bound O-acyl transferase) family protein [Citrus sinensis]
MGDLTLLHFFLYRVLHEETAFRFYFGSSTYSSLFLIVFTEDIRSRYLVILRMISFGYDYHWAQQGSHFDHEKHVQRCHVCKSGKLCYQIQQERNISENYALAMYLCYLVYAPLYISGPIISFNAFASQLEVPQNNYLRRDVLWYGLRWIFSLLLMELMTHIFYYNAFAISGMWKLLSPLDVFIVGYGDFLFLKICFSEYSMFNRICGIEAPENMPRKLLSWAWLTCLFFIPEMVVKSAADSFQAESAFGRFLVRELRAFAGSITITCLMIANLVGYVIGPSGVNWLMSQFLTREGLPVLGGMFLTFYVGTKLMFQISDAKQRKQ